MIPQDRVAKALKHIAACRLRPSVRLLDAIYGPQARVLRTHLAALLLDRKVTGSDPEAQYGRLRALLVNALGAVGNCTATLNADFESRAEEMLAEAVAVERVAIAAVFGVYDDDRR